MQAHFHYIYLISSNHYHIAIDITLQISLLVWNHSSFSAQNILILLSLTLLGNLLHSLTGYITCHLFYVIWNEHFYFSFGVKLARNAKIFLFFKPSFKTLDMKCTECQIFILFFTEVLFFEAFLYSILT